MRTPESPEVFAQMFIDFTSDDYVCRCDPLRGACYKCPLWKRLIHWPVYRWKHR